MVIRQGDVYWARLLDLSEQGGSAVRPYVVIQNDLFNNSTVNSVVTCALTSNLDRARAPGNVLLKQGEGNLPRHSVVNVTQIYTALKSDLIEKIGTLSRARVSQILEGIDLVIKPREAVRR
ncbi:MAG: type II toxin-antitoxin system PemK/MazF family toxin [Actinobacteria bacterium]|nr:type II toxin-antitoxin system PemK/MazF family toxin [Actinomycetota bacterium]MBU1944157.1 type II toxin-antitoxin system PemK/MazF family toxin [Actinomycetota bacterium]MBU2687476.1 type II toxin-antitoxin system PemK/MazF family toxin [Actinomycetota bacterium]